MKWKERFIVILLLCAIFVLLRFRGQLNSKVSSPVVQINVDLMKNKDDDIMRFNNEKHDKDDTYPQWSGMHPWDIWMEMVSARAITVESEKFVKLILNAMAKSKILKANVGFKGTQLKAMFKLAGPEEQLVVFKPKRYERGRILSGTPYEGYDRHNAEIAAFHLDRILGFYRAPPAIGRYVDLKSEMKPVCKKKLLNTFFEDGENMCFYGVCMYCRKEEPACAKGSLMEGSLTLWLPAKWKVGKMRHPWQRTYKKRKAILANEVWMGHYYHFVLSSIDHRRIFVNLDPSCRKKGWETDMNYCESVLLKSPYNEGPRLLDIMDTAIFDFLIGNADRHHYEYLVGGGNRGMLLHLDNGKSFGNPHVDERSILAPIYHCCRLRKSTYERLKTFSISSGSSLSLSSLLTERIKDDPIYPILTEAHLQAIDRRLKITFDTLANCFVQKGEENVLFSDNL